MSIEINLQIISNEKNIPTKTEFKRWIKAALPKNKTPIEITLRIVDAEEMQALNNYYRGKNKPTNILSFPFVVPAGIETPLLGDLVICAPLVKQEAQKQQKTIAAHWAHLTIHGILHLLGYDHESAKNAKIMEDLEIKYLQNLGFKNPYESF
jgi:probable rRNA maturation factor